MKRWGLLMLLAAAAHGGETNDLSQRIEAIADSLSHVDARLARQMNELLWGQRLNDVAIVDKVQFAGLPPRPTTNVTAAIGSNAVVVPALTFLPRHRNHWRKIPLVVLAHGEIHGNVVSDEEAHVVRELVQQGYAVIAPDYRGSSGYGSDYWRQIDYGGREVDDVDAARQWMLDRHRYIDSRRVGIAGWSHGGMIALLAAFAHPESYAACYAGVPVSDLEERIRIRGKGYEQLFSAPYHLGRTVAEAPEEYRRRSPAANVEKLRVPLLIHANTSDEDVTVDEIQHLTRALEKAGKPFQYHLYTNAPGGHSFNRIDTAEARRSRAEIWDFFARYLRPDRRGAAAAGTQ